MENHHEPIGEDWNGKPLYKGPRGGVYYLDNSGVKKHIRTHLTLKEEKTKKKRRVYEPRRRGAFFRHLQNQVDSEGNRMNLYE